jgi:hypothetical protein
MPGWEIFSSIESQPIIYTFKQQLNPTATQFSSRSTFAPLSFRNIPQPIIYTFKQQLNSHRDLHLLRSDFAIFHSQISICRLSCPTKNQYEQQLNSHRELPQLRCSCCHFAICRLSCPTKHQYKHRSEPLISFITHLVNSNLLTNLETDARVCCVQHIHNIKWRKY